MTEHVELTIDDLILDLRNPRLGSTSSQSDALASIVGLSPGHFRNLMESIRDDGLDPGDSLYVIPSDDGEDSVVLEGNRRVSALKVLNNPDILAGTDLPESTKKLLVREAIGFERSKVEPIRCVRFDSREEANDWIRRRHTGVAGGEGRITWKPLEIQRFSSDYTTIDVIDFIGRNAGYSKGEWEKAESALRGGKSTNITRLMESAVAQAHLGITVQAEPSRKTPVLGVEPDWAVQVLKRVVDDILRNKVNSRTLNTATDIEKYFANLPSELQPGPERAAATPTAFRDISLPGSQAKPSQKPPLKTRSAPRTRKTLAPKKHPFDTTKSTKLGMLLKEAGTLDVGKFPLSCAFVLRAVVELTVNDYMDDNSLPRRQKGSQAEFDLKRKADDVLKHIVSSGAFSSTDVRAFRRNLLDKKSACSIQALNGFVHGPYDLPTADALRAGWESAVPVLIATYGNV